MAQFLICMHRFGPESIATETNKDGERAVYSLRKCNGVCQTIWRTDQPEPVVRLAKVVELGE